MLLNENTVTKLQEMRLGAMAQAFKTQMSDPNMADLSFEEHFGLLVDHEWTTRKNNHLNRLIKSATLRSQVLVWKISNITPTEIWTKRR